MILVMGLGYVGLTTAVGLAYKKNKVFGFDVDADKVSKIKRGSMPFLEPGVGQALQATLKTGHFCPTMDLASAVRDSKVIMICVGTPSTPEGVDLKYIYAALDGILPHIKGRKVIVIRSTVPPGTACGEIAGFIESRGFKVGRDIGLASNPEFLREGSAWADFLEGNRIVVGASDKKSLGVLRGIYRGFPGTFLQVSLTTAEFVKYLSNTLLATLISFSNEMATFAEHLEDIDVKTSFKLLHMDKRWWGQPASMAAYVYPGCGFGGACLPKDTLAMLRSAESRKFPMPLLKSVLEVNTQRPQAVLKQINARADGKMTGKRVTVLGLSFKPNTNDVRHTPALPIIEGLLREGAKVTVYDPVAMADFQATGAAVTYAPSFEQAVKKAQYVVICTAWPQFKKVFTMFPKARIIDGRYMGEPQAARRRE
ncbi:MAG: UDP-glucose/GDP-mannose dehydrogenase family protein [Candidatus Omnitrophica bacterium]|nr:UDP-glucose/GDP-mannose dehydrogenase family protein [Candidatus Omnitrophota bacterium]